MCTQSEIVIDLGQNVCQFDIATKNFMNNANGPSNITMPGSRLIYC